MYTSRAIFCYELMHTQELGVCRDTSLQVALAFSVKDAPTEAFFDLILQAKKKEDLINNTQLDLKSRLDLGNTYP